MCPIVLIINRATHSTGRYEGNIINITKESGSCAGWCFIPIIPVIKVIREIGVRGCTRLGFVDFHSGNCNWDIPDSFFHICPATRDTINGIRNVIFHLRDRVRAQ